MALLTAQFLRLRIHQHRKVLHRASRMLRQGIRHLIG